MLVRTPQNNANYTITSSTATTAFIAKYEVPEPEGSKNKMTIYKLYPFGSLNVMYPASQGGVEPYMTVLNRFFYCSNEYDAEYVIVPINTNVKFSVEISAATTANWVRLMQGDGILTGETESYRTYSANRENFSIFVFKASTSTRTARFIIKCIEPGVSEEQCPDITVELTQYPNQVQALSAGTVSNINRINTNINTINDKIEELSGNT